MKFLLLLLLPAAACFAQPGISVVPDTLNFGVITARDFLQGEIKVLNRGTDTLVIKNIETTCGCTRATPDAAKVASMEAATIRVSATVSRYIGHFVEYVMLQTNDPKNPTTNIAVIADIIPDTTKK